MHANLLNRERDYDYKCLEHQQLSLEVQKAERAIEQSRSTLVTQAEKIRLLRESVRTQEIKKALSQSQA